MRFFIIRDQLSYFIIVLRFPIHDINNGDNEGRTICITTQKTKINLQE